MMPVHALRRRLDHLPKGFIAQASRHGVVHAGVDLQLYGIDVIASAALPPEEDAPFALPHAEGDDGPEASEPRWHGALPFDPESVGAAHLAAMQLCIADGAIFATAIGDDPGEIAHRLDRLSDETLQDVEEFQASPQILSLREEPSRQRYMDLVVAAVSAMHASSSLEKVVLARRVLIELSSPLDPATALHQMEVREPSCTRYCLPLDNGRLVGASPELVLSRHGDIISSHPLAGTIALTGEDIDMALLAGSAKDVEEHRLVVDDIAERLSMLVEELNVPATPSIVELRDVAHLGTSISGRLLLRRPSALALLRAVHPTPAIGGVPRAESLGVIRALEGRDRGLFGGAVGWSTAGGDGEWVLAIRGALLQGTSVEVTAGAGIVPASDPTSEGEETRVKLASILEALLPGSSELLSRD